MNSAEIGDAVFCIPESNDVILLEKNIGITELCRYRNSEGIERTIFPYYLCVISKGMKSATLIANDYDKKLELSARRQGFRVEKEESREGIVYKIYGDSQQEVDDFVNNYYLS